MLNNSCETTLTWQILFMTPYHAYGRTFISARWRILQYTKEKVLVKQWRAENGTKTCSEGVWEYVIVNAETNNHKASLGPQQQHTQSFRISFTLWVSLYILKFMYTWGRADILRWGEHDTFNSFLGSSEKNQTFLSSSCYSTHSGKHTHTI